MFSSMVGFFFFIATILCASPPPQSISETVLKYQQDVNHTSRPLATCAQCTQNVKTPKQNTAPLCRCRSLSCECTKTPLKGSSTVLFFISNSSHTNFLIVYKMSDILSVLHKSRLVRPTVQHPNIFSLQWYTGGKRHRKLPLVKPEAENVLHQNCRWVFTALINFLSID